MYKKNKMHQNNNRRLNMKKIIAVVSVMFIFLSCGCGQKLLNTPTKKVEMFFGNYNSLNDEVIKQLDKTIAEEEEFNTDQRSTYKELMKKHYQNIKYDIKDEKIDGDVATVTVEVEVTDYTKAMEEAEEYLKQNPKEFQDSKGEYDKSLYVTYRLNQLKKVKDTVKYTLELTLTKVNDEWKMDQISDIDERKIHGMYQY